MNENTLGPVETTSRGFEIIHFKDLYDTECSLQQSSLATEAAIWLGVLDPEPKIMASQAAQHRVKTDETTGWVPYSIPEEVLISTRMHLTHDQVVGLIATLQRWVDTESFEESAA